MLEGASLEVGSALEHRHVVWTTHVFIEEQIS
jgi:hypothetical protein